MLGRQVITRHLLADQLRNLGIEPGGVLVVHASFRAFGPIEAGPPALIEVLHEVLGPSGTLVMPSMSGSRRTDPYDLARTPTRDMGIVAETFWRMSGTLRSDHPTSSFAANGPLAREITAPQPLSPGHGLASPIGRVYRLGGSILLLGVGHDANTTIHLAESIAQVPYHIRKWATMLRDGMPERVEYDETDHCCRNFALLDGWLRQRGLQNEGIVGGATARLMQSKGVVETVVPRLKQDPLRFLCLPNAGCEECDAARRSVASRGISPEQMRRDDAPGDG